MYARSIATAALVLLAACSDDALVSPDGAPALRDTRQESVTLNANGTDELDDTQAFKDALGAGRNVYVPAGTYYVNETLVVPSNTRIHGAGATLSRIRQRKTALTSGLNPTGVVAHRANIFYVPASSAGHNVNVTVEDLGFVGEGSPYQFALRVEKVSGLVFQNNRADSIGLVDVAHNLWAGALSSEAELSTGIVIQNNTGRGRTPHDREKTPGIYVEYAKNGNITNNTVKNYHVGILVWGGEANPESGGYVSGTWRAQNFRIDWNQADSTDTGIMTARADSIRAFRNRVSNCTDVCLDAEGSSNVEFNENWGYNAGNGVLAVFFEADSVRFAWNEVHQDGRIAPNNKGEMVQWDKVFAQVNEISGKGNPRNRRIFVHNNWFYYDRTDGVGVGKVVKESTHRMLFANNILTDVVFDVQPDFAGHVELWGNTITLNRGTGGKPAFNVGGTIGDEGSRYELWMWDNTVDSKVYQGNGVPAVYVSQYASPPLLSVFRNNTLKGFATAFHIVNAGSDNVYGLEANKYTGAFFFEQNNAYDADIQDWGGNTQI